MTGNVTYYSYNAYKRAYENHSLPQWGSVQYPDPNTTGSTTSMAMTTPSGIIITIHNLDGTTNTIDKYRGLGYKFVSVANVNGTYSAEISEMWVDSPDFVPKFDSQGNPISSEYGAGTWVMPPMHVSEDIPTHPGYTAHVNVQVVWSPTSKTDYPELATIDDQGKVTTSNSGLWEVLTTTKEAVDIGSQFNVDVTYTPNTQTGKISYVDGKGNEIGTTSLKGTTDSQVTVTPKAPAGWKITSGQNIPTTVTATATGIQTVTVKVEHATVTVTPDHPKTTSDNLPDNPGKKYPAGVDKDSLNKTVTQTINITKPGQTTPATQTQIVTFTRTATVDEEDGTVSYGQWSENGTHNFEGVTVPTVAGYTASGTVDQEIVTPDSDSSTVNITYTANPQTGKISYVDDSGKEIGTTTLSGPTNSTITVTPKAPAGWKIVSGQDIPATVTATATGISPVTVKVEHATVTVNPDHPKTTSDNLPDNPGKTYPTGVDKDSLNKTVTRTINITKPGQTSPTTQTQTVTFIRTATVDEEDGTVSYGKWSENGTHTFDGVTVPTFAGYTTHGAVDKVTVTPDSDSSTVNITYQANPQTGKISYVDDSGKEIGTTTLNGTTDSQVTVTPKAPAGWKIVSGQDIPATVTATATGIQTVTVTVKHATVTVSPDQPKTTSDNLPDNPGKTYPAGVDKDSLNKTVTRTINITKPGQTSPTTQTQTVTFTRTATVDEETGTVTSYGDWSEQGKHNFPAVNVNVPGYTASETIDQEAVMPESTNSTVNITYTANPGTQTIHYVDKGGKLIGSQTINGHTDDDITVTPSLPTGWVLAKNSGMPGDVTIKPSDTPINVTIQHGSRQVQPTDPVQPGEKTPSGTVINGGHESDLNKDVSRVIKVTKPDGTVTTETQTAHLTRTATVDTVNGQVTYGPWTIGHWDTYDVPAVPGYTPSQSQVAGQDVDSNTVSQTVNISYLAKARGKQGSDANGAGPASAGQAGATANGDAANGQDARAKQGKLPQTGNQNSVIAALGLGLLGLLGLYDGRRKQD